VRNTGLPIAALAWALLPAGALAQTADYLDFDGFTRELRSLVNASNLATMSSLGTSHQGRDIWLVEVADRSGTPLDERPAVLVVGNLEGDHVVGSHLALEIVRYLIGGESGADLAEQVFYVVPRLNPDGAQAMFSPVKWGRRGNALPHDDDNDGRTDEDGPDDLNGDGFITVMRAMDPAGAFMIDPDEPRLMKRADAAEGQSGGYTLYWEGLDNDGDGFINEDGPGGVDPNRNFQHAYPYWKADAGAYMVSEPETRALMDWVIAHRNVAAILTFGHSDNVVDAGSQGGGGELDLLAFADASNDDVLSVGVFGGGGGGFGFGFGGRGGGGGLQLRGAQLGADNDPSSGRRPVMAVQGSDLTYYQAIADAYEEITGIDAVGVDRPAEGAFFQYGHFQYGVPSFSTQGWGLGGDGVGGASSDEGGGEAPAADPAAPPTAGRGGATGARGGGAGGRAGRGAAPQARSGGAGNGADARILTALEEAGIDAFVDWTPYQHPTLGEVEIGGFVPYAVTNPPFERVPELGRAHGEFVVRLAGMLPRVSIVSTEVESHGGGVFTVTAEIENSGFLPTSLQHGVTSRAVQPTMVQIQVPREDILTGAPKTAYVQQLAGSGARESFTWVIRGRAGATVEIRLRSQKGGTDTATVTLR
jgi:hypothetical protein